jgi:hypothetical protein
VQQFVAQVGVAQQLVRQLRVRKETTRVGVQQFVLQLAVPQLGRQRRPRSCASLVETIIA